MKLSRSAFRNEGSAARTAEPSKGLLLQQCTGALVERRKGLVARNRADQLVEIPGTLGFRGLLDLEQVGRMDAAAVGFDRTLAEQRIVGRHRLHLVDDLDAVMRIAAERFQRLEIMQ